MQAIKNFFKLEAATGILLCLSAVIAIIFVNSPLNHFYEKLLHLHFGFDAGPLHLDLTVHHWVNDGLMAVFFLLVGLEIKRELVEGELSSWSQIALPAIAAAGGMLLPALVYVAFNWGDAESIRGWAIPAATDIAFALGVLSLFGKRVPISLKVFLTALAIFDDLGAIVIIALFYSKGLNFVALGLAGAACVALAALNRAKVVNMFAYMFLGFGLWLAVFHSGVHATLAGVTLAFFIPMKSALGDSPLKKLEHDLHPWVSFGVLPIFGFANAGIPLLGATVSSVMNPIALGTMLGLFVGKQVGIAGFCWVAFKMKWAKMPNNANWASFYGVCMLGGIGFTMSLFVSMLAFTNPAYMEMARMGVVLGSLASGVFGFLMVKWGLSKMDDVNEEEEDDENHWDEVKILVGEDSVVSQNSIVSLLESAGVHVTLGRDGEELMKLYESEDFDMILFDVQTPILQGAEALRRIKSNDPPVNDKTVPIIAMSEKDDVELAPEMDGLIVKPVERRELLGALTQHLMRWKEDWKPKGEPAAH